MNPLKKYREEIDRIDKIIIQFLAKRFFIAEKIGKYKRKFQLKIKDKGREKEIFEKRKKLAKKLNLPSNFIEKTFKLIIEETIKKEKKNYD